MQAMPAGAAGIVGDRVRVIDRFEDAGSGTGGFAGASAGGSSGAAGASGASGSGVAGAIGQAGSAGRAGSAASAASGGNAGAAGIAGSAGSAGQAGIAGQAGAAGASGTAAPSCGEGTVLCPDGTCGKLRYRFESGTDEGVRLVPENSKAAVSAPSAAIFEGQRVLRTDLRVENDNRNLNARVDICGGAPVDLHLRPVSVNVLLDGPALPASAGEHSISLYVWTATANYMFARAQNPSINTWYTLSGELSGADAKMVQGVGYYIYVNGSGGESPWTGTVYVDDLFVDD